MDKYRTKCFVNEKIRVDSHRALIRKNRSHSNNRESQDSIKQYDGSELYVQDFKIQEPMIPYAVKGQQVTAQGFVRDEPSLFDRIMNRYQNWHEGRRDQQGNMSVSGNESNIRKSQLLDGVISRSASKFGGSDMDTFMGLNQEVLDSPEM